MQKLMKNWIFTLIVCALLAILTTLLLLDGFGVGDLFIARDIIHILTALVLLLYVIFALFPLFVRYKNKGVRVCLGCEIAVLVFTAFAQMFSRSASIPFFSTMQSCSVVGLAVWLHFSMQLIRAYLTKGGEGSKQVPLWLFCCYILLNFVGAWQIVSPLIPNRYFVFAIASLSLVFAGIFGAFTVQNRKALPKKPRKTQQTETAETALAEVQERE